MNVYRDDLEKKFIFDLYSRLYEDFKDYDKITKKKMFEEIKKFYGDYKNIIDICTYRELMFLKKISNSTVDSNDKKYEFEQSTLSTKMLITYDFSTKSYLLADEFKDNILLALKKANMKDVKEKTKLNEFLVGFCKVMGNFYAYPLIELASSLFNIDTKIVFNHVFNNKLFKYYIMIYDKYIEEFKKNMPICLFASYYYWEEELDKSREQYGIAGSQEFNLNQYINIFYDDFNFDNKTVKKFYNELMSLPFFGFTALESIRVYALLNKERDSLKESISNVPALKNVDLKDFFILMDKAMDEMPSGALNGMCPREYKEKLKENEEYEEKKYKNYIKQNNACLGDDVAKGFYNLYFSLLEYVNNKYHVNTNIKKIYKQENLDPNNLMPIIEYLFKNKEKIIDNYLKDNPHKLDNKSLEKVSKFKHGIRDMFTIAKYEEDYTALLASDRVYMIKGLNSNIDEVIPYEDIPCIITTSLFPYEGVIVYDGLFSTYPISMGTSFEKMVEKEYREDIKYYHL